MNASDSPNSGSHPRPTPLWLLLLAPLIHCLVLCF